jgi:hypothetical protein
MIGNVHRGESWVVKCKNKKKKTKKEFDYKKKWE